MPAITRSPSSTLFPASEVNVLIDALSQKSSLTPEMAITLDRINTLEHVGFISSKSALALKNNLNNELEAEGILAELILDCVKQGQLAPDMKIAVSKRKLDETILLLYTCYLEQIRCAFNPTVVQQQVYKDTPKALFERMKQAEEMESKDYVMRWLQSLKFSHPECRDSLTPLLTSLEDGEFKKLFLKFIETLQTVEEALPHKFALQELHALLKTKSGAGFFLATSQFLKAAAFYQKHLHEIETGDHKDRQFSLCLAADMIKNAPHAGKLPTYYHLLYGLIKKQWEATSTLIKKPFVILEGPSSDEKAISHTMEGVFRKTKQPFYTVPIAPLKENSKALTQSLIKMAPQGLLAAAEPRYQDFLLSHSKRLGLPLTFFPPYTETSKWEETSHDALIAFPTPLNPDIPEEINLENTKIAGIPGLFSNTKSAEELRIEWGFSPDKKIIVVDTPEGSSPWPAYLTKEYRASSEIALVILTDAKNKEFIHTLKTKIAPQTTLPIKIYTSLSSLEREQLLTLSDLVISKEREYDSSLIFETSHAKTPLLLDHCPSPLFSGGLFGFLRRIPSLFSFKKESPLVEIHEKILSDQNRGILIRSAKNFKLSIEELLFQGTPIPSQPHLVNTLPTIMKEAKYKTSAETEKKCSVLDPLIFTTH